LYRYIAVRDGMPNHEFFERQFLPGVGLYKSNLVYPEIESAWFQPALKPGM
jgi:hypothetical protein